MSFSIYALNNWISTQNLLQVWQAKKSLRWNHHTATKVDRRSDLFHIKYKMQKKLCNDTNLTKCMKLIMFKNRMACIVIITYRLNVSCILHCNNRLQSNLYPLEYNCANKVIDSPNNPWKKQSNKAFLANSYFRERGPTYNF